jgi:S-adenosylmethionine hydrolase
MIITLTTDFGMTDPFVGIMKGVIAARAPGATVVDVTHGVPAQDVVAGALVLRHAVPYFPADSIHVAVVDPGVGTDRRPLCVETGAGMLVGPDNGVLSLAATALETRRVIHLTEERFFLSPRSRTFHGRDVFAPVAAALATGTPPAALGKAVTDMKHLDVPRPRCDGDRVHGVVIYVDRFGNLVTNVDAGSLAAFQPGALVILAAGARIDGVRDSYGAVGRGELVAVVDSWDLLELAVRDGSAADRLGARVGAPVVVEGA